MEPDQNFLVLDDATKQIIAEYVKVMNEAQSRAQLVIQVYLNAKGKIGTWDLSSDGTSLIKRIEIS